MGSWGVVPTIAFPFQTAKQGSEMTQYSQVDKMNKPDAGDVQEEKDINKDMLPAQGEWYKSNLTRVDSMKDQLLQERTAWFMANKGKRVPPEIGKKWNEDIARAEDMRIKLKSQEGRLKQNFKDVTTVLQSDIASEKSSARRLMTDEYGVPIIGMKTNGYVGQQNLAEVLLSNDRLPGNIGNPTVANVYIPETQFTGTFENRIYTSLSRASKSEGNLNREQFSVDAGIDKWVYTITHANNASEVWNAAGNIMNSLTSKEWNDLRSDFWENIHRSGGKTTTGDFVFDAFGLTKDEEGNPTLGRGQYTLAKEKDQNKINLIENILNNRKPKTEGELRLVQDMITEYGMHRIMNMIPSQIEQKYTQDKIQIKGVDSPVGTFHAALMGQPTISTTTLPKEQSSTTPDVMDPMKRYELGWEGYEKNLLQSPTFKSLRKIGGETDQQFAQRQRDYIQNSKTLFAETYLGPDAKRILQEHNGLIGLQKYEVSPAAFMKSGYAMRPISNETFWWIGAKDVAKVTPNMFKQTPFIINVSSILRGDRLFPNNPNNTLAVADALVYKDDLKNFKYTLMEGGKPREVDYETLLDDYPGIAENIIVRSDKDPLYTKSKIEALAKMGDKGSMIEDWKANDDDYYRIKVYINNDGALESAVKDEQKDLKIQMNQQNRAEQYITQ